jgi:hypothetical protein
MDRAPQFHLALNVDDSPCTKPHPRCDTTRMTEGEIAQLQNRKTIDLANFPACGVDQDRATLDFLLKPLSEPVGAMLLHVDCALDIVSTDFLPARFASPIIGFAQKIGYFLHLDRELLCVAGEP